MTPFRARLTLLAMMALLLATAGNALFLQERPVVLRGAASGRVPLSHPSSFELSQTVPVPSGAVPPSSKLPQETRIQIALQRELTKHGYADQLRAAKNGLRFAVLAYEFDNSLPLTGEPAETLLKRLLFDLNQAPKGFFADRAEANSQLVMEVQKTLLGLGFFRGTLSGRMDAWTEGAVKDFERHRGLPPAGRLTEAALLALINYAGQPLHFSSG
jgi:Putative peptidoglycan binding domain